MRATARENAKTVKSAGNVTVLLDRVEPPARFEIPSFGNF